VGALGRDHHRIGILDGAIDQLADTVDPLTDRGAS
jgi:hypothetical protein